MGLHLRSVLVGCVIGVLFTSFFFDAWYSGGSRRGEAVAEEGSSRPSRCPVCECPTLGETRGVGGDDEAPACPEAVPCECPSAAGPAHFREPFLLTERFADRAPRAEGRWAEAALRERSKFWLEPPVSEFYVDFVPRCQTVRDLPAILHTLGLHGVGVEVGVQRGEHAAHLMRFWRYQELHLVDLWAVQDESVYVDLANGRSMSYELNMTKGNVALWAPDPAKVHLHQIDSAQGASLFEDGSVDFVYIDANHAFQQTVNDIRSWWPKLREGGVMAGDDYRDLVYNEPETRKDVDLFACRSGVEAAVLREFYQTLSACEDQENWFFIKRTVKHPYVFWHPAFDLVELLGPKAFPNQSEAFAPRPRSRPALLSAIERRTNFIKGPNS